MIFSKNFVTIYLTAALLKPSPEGFRLLRDENNLWKRNVTLRQLVFDALLMTSDYKTSDF